MKRLCMIASLIAGIGPAAAVSQERGSLLVATEQIADEAFAQTVVLLLHYDADGAIGVAINRPTWVSTREAFPEREALHGYRGDIFHGGPLGQATVLVFSREPSPAAEATDALLAGIYVSSDLERFEADGERPRSDSLVRFYAGHASWGPGQLDEEIAAGAWQAVAASAALVFDPDPGSLWERLTRARSEMTVYERVSPGALATTR